MLDDPPDLVIFEEPVPKFDSSLLMGLRGVMLGITRAHHVKLREVPVGTWRLYFLGSGKLKRDAPRRVRSNCARLDGAKASTTTRRSRRDVVVGVREGRADQGAAP